MISCIPARLEPLSIKRVYNVIIDLLADDPPIAATVEVKSSYEKMIRLA